MTVPEQHQRKIALQTMKYHCVGAWVMGGMDHVQAAAVLGKKVPEGCTCGKGNTDESVQEVQA